MGAIAGIADLGGAPGPTRAELSAMLGAMPARRPAGAVYYLDRGIGLAQGLLQPAAKVAGEGRNQPDVRVVCSGEIYNRHELCRQLGATSGATLPHLLAALYRQHGTGCVHRLNGQFAFALWDRLRRRLLLARDRVGIMPLHYSLQRGRLLFASEIKALLPLFDQAPELDPVALDQLFTFWTARPPRTLFRGVQQLLPGELLVVEGGRLRRQRYWDWEFPVEPDQYAAAAPDRLADELRALLADAVRLRLPPSAAYLSGGLDSSALVALMRQLGEGPPHTFSLGFPEAGLDESRYQRRMAAAVGSVHRQRQCRPAEIAARLPEAVRHAETPFLRMAPVPMSLLSAEARQAGFAAVLTGEGADEVLGGYDIFKEAAIRRFWARQPQSTLRPQLLRRLYPYLPLQQQGLTYLRGFFGRGLEQAARPCFSHLPRWTTTAMCKQFFAAELKAALEEDAIAQLEQELPPAMTRWAPLNQAQYLEMTILLPGYLLAAQGERMLMANTITGRFPFLDHRVIEFAARLPPHLKLNVLNEKYLLKKAVSGLLPEEILERHKQPYRAPDIAAFFPGPQPDYVMDLLGTAALRRNGYFCPRKVERLLRKARAGQTLGVRDNMAFVGILTTQLWHHVFIDGWGTEERRRDRGPDRQQRIAGA